MADNEHDTGPTMAIMGGHLDARFHELLSVSGYREKIAEECLLSDLPRVQF